jgi:DNA-binding CsgD family transcriptional regulator
VVPSRGSEAPTHQGLPRSTAVSSRRIVVTPRQAEILSLVARGLGDKAIADTLGVAPRTIRTHLERLFREYGLSSRSEAVAVWLRSKRR